MSLDSSPRDMPEPRGVARVGDARGHGAVAVALAVGIILFAALAVAFFAWRWSDAAYTPDFPWLWRTGDYILAHGVVPAGDIFSWTVPGSPWVLYQWLFEALVAAVRGVLGERLLFAAFGCAALAVYFAAPLCGAVPRRVSAAFILPPAGLGLAVATVNLSLRPMLATAALLLVQYVLVQRLRRGEGRLGATIAWLVPLYALWGNVHTGVVLGLLSLALFAIGDLMEARGPYGFRPVDSSIEGRPVAPSRYGLMLVAAFAASLLNPYGFGIYVYIADLSAQSYLNALIEELRSPDFHQPRFGWFLILVGGLFALMTRARRVVSAADLLHLVVFTVATFYAARFVVWAALLYAIVLPRALHHVWSASAGRAGSASVALIDGLASRSTRRILALAGLLVPAVWIPSQATSIGACTELAPALAAYDAVRLPGDRVFMDPESGSCALARDASERVFIDTRFDFYGTDFVRPVIETLRLRPGWQRLLEQWRIDTAILAKSWPLAQALAADPAVVVLFEDADAIVVRRSMPWPTDTPAP